MLTAQPAAGWPYLTFPLFFLSFYYSIVSCLMSSGEWWLLLFPLPGSRPSLGLFCLLSPSQSLTILTSLQSSALLVVYIPLPGSLCMWPESYSYLFLEAVSVKGSPEESFLIKPPPYFLLASFDSFLSNCLCGERGFDKNPIFCGLENYGDLLHELRLSAPHVTLYLFFLSMHY